MIQTPFFEGRVNRTEMKKSARERTARHRRRERGLLRACAGAAIDRRVAARWCACAAILAGLGAGGAAAVLPSSSGAASTAAAAAGAAACLPLDFAAALRFRFFRRRAELRQRRCLGVRWSIAAGGRPCRDPSVRPVEARHAFGEYRLAVDRAASSWYRGSRSRSDGSKCQCPAAAASAPESAMRTAVAIRRCGRRMVVSTTRFPGQLWRLAAAGPAALRRASAGSAASAPSLAIRSSHCRVAAASLARHADSASNSRAAVAEALAPDAAEPRGAPSCWDSWCFPAAAARRGCAPDPARRRRHGSGRQRFRRTSWPRPACRARQLPRPVRRPRQHAIAERRLRREVGEGRLGLGMLVRRRQAPAARVERSPRLGRFLGFQILVAAPAAHGGDDQERAGTMI